MPRRFAIAAYLMLAVVVSAQQPPELERGFRPELAYQFGDVDSINLFNGNLNLAIPLGSFPVASDVSYSFVLRYAGNVWGHYYDCPDIGPTDPDPPPCEPTFYPLEENAGMGWQLSFGRLEMTHSLYGTQLPTGGTVKYISPDGAEHNFYETLHDPRCPSTGDCDPIVVGVFYTRDGSYLRLKVAGGDRIIEFPDGQRHRYEYLGGTAWRLAYIYGQSSTLDANGIPQTNWVHFEYPSGSHDWKITDSHGREHWVAFGSGDYNVKIDEVRIAAPRDPSASPASPQPYATVALTYGAYTLDGTGQPVNGPLAVLPRPCYYAGTVTAALLTRVDLPTGETWNFTYDTNPNDCRFPGSLIRATLPTKGNLNWSYGSIPFAGGVAATAVKERCLRRDANPCSATSQTAMQDQYTTYTQAYGAAAPAVQVDTLARNSGSVWRVDTRTLHYFDVYNAADATFGLPFARTIGDGSTADRKLSTDTFDCDPETGLCAAASQRRQFVKYEMDAIKDCDPAFPCNHDRNRRVIAERTLYPTDGNRFVDVERAAFDGLGHYRSTTNAGFDSNAPVRQSYTAFHPSAGTYALTSTGTRASGYVGLASTAPWILGTYTTSYVNENGSSSSTEACFDAATGFLQRLRLKADATGASGPHDLLRVFTRDAASGYAAREEYFGGDLQTVGTAGQLCTMALPQHDASSFRIDHTYEYGALKTSRFAGMSWFNVDNAKIDQSTGLVLQSRDSAGALTTYTYDSARRLASVAPPGIAATTYSYVPASSVSSPARIAARFGTGTMRTEQQWEFDPYGRVALERRLMPGACDTKPVELWSVRKKTYDSAGRVASLSEWEDESEATFTKKMEYGGFDAFGRPGTITTADGKATTFTYTGDRVTTRTYSIAAVSGDTAVSIEEHRDRAARLVQVVEDASGTRATTDYTYDERDRLTGVTMWGTGTTQSRAFVYDHRGLLASETHPESGTTSFAYDAKGNVVTKTTPVATLTNAYDAGGRLTTSTASGVGPLKEFTYETLTGRLATATRHNRSAELGDITVKESYQYNGLGGRLSRKDTTVTRPSGEVTQFYDQYTYNTLGDLGSLSYPLCVAGTACASMPVVSRTVSPTYQYGYVTDVAPYTNASTSPTSDNRTGISYHPNGVVNTIEHANVDGGPGPRLKQTLGADKMPRVASISVSNFCQGLTVSAPAPQPRAVPYNGVAGLSVSAVGATSYQWYRVDGPVSTALSGQTGATLTIPVTETTIYFVRVGNGACTVDSVRATVTVQSCVPPDATITAPASMTASTTASATVASTPGATYRWTISSGGTIVSGQGTSAISFRANCSGPVALAVTVSNGCPSSDTDSVIVNPASAALSVVGASTILQNGTAQVRLTFTGTGPWTVTWSDLPSQPQTIQPQSNPYVRTVSPNVTTSYSASVTDAFSCAMTVSGAPVTITVKPPAPSNVRATALTATQVLVTWSFAGTADRFDIYRSGTTLPIGTQNGSMGNFTDTSATTGTAYVYSVKAVKANTGSDASNGDLATTILFADDPVVAAVTPIRALHMTQLQSAVNAVRAAAGLAAQSFPPIVAGSTAVSAQHVESLRTALAPARTALGLPPMSYTRSPMTAGLWILALDLEETREAVR